MQKKLNKFIYLQNLSLIFILIVIISLFWILDRQFVSIRSIKNMLLAISVIGMTTVPMTLLMISGGVDLSVGALMGFSSSLVALFLSKNLSIWAAVLLTLLAGSVVGLINGLVVTKIKVNAFIATIAMLSILNGIALVMTSTKGQTATFSGSIGINKKSFSFLGLGEVYKVPVQVLVLIFFFIAGYILLNYTQFGRKIYASGAGEKVAILSGINVDRVRMINFVLTSFTASLGGIILASQFLAGHPRVGAGYELLIITAVILGGTAFSGGVGTIQGVLFGILIMGSLRYGMDIVGLEEYYKQVSNGAILLIAVGFGVIREKIAYKN